MTTKAKKSTVAGLMAAFVVATTGIGAGVHYGLTKEYTKTFEGRFTGSCEIKQGWTGIDTPSNLIIPATFESELTSIMLYDNLEHELNVFKVDSTYAPKVDGKPLVSCEMAFKKDTIVKLSYKTNLWQEHILEEKPEWARIISPRVWHP